MKIIKYGVLEYFEYPWQKQNDYALYIKTRINKYFIPFFDNKYKFEYIDNVNVNECDICFYNLFSINYDDLKNESIFTKVKGNPIFILYKHNEYPYYPELQSSNIDTLKIWTNNFKNYSISTYDDSPTNLFFPLFDIESIKKHIDDRQKFDISIKSKFANWISSNPCLPRKNMIDYLNEHYKHIDYYGDIYYGNNTLNKGQKLPGHFFQDNDIHYLYKFNFAFENCATKDNVIYISEKIEHGYRNNSIPIYWGCSNVIKFFNTESFINLCGLTYDEMISKISEVDNNDELYKHMFYSYPFKDKNFDYIGFFEERLKKFLQNILEQI